MKELFDHVSIRCSRLTTRSYSTSFSFGILCLEKKLRDPIYSVYGFVRFADEIVDTFHHYDKASLFARFRRNTMEALHERISINPILNSFQATVHQYQIEQELIDLFLNSMEMDLHRKDYDEHGFKEYVTGSAEVVGLMCLRVFAEGNDAMYERLKPYAMSLGSAFQKVNFLRDLKADKLGLGRTYFPDLQHRDLNCSIKDRIEDSIQTDFAHAFIGVKKLPRSARLGVYVAYMYYLALFRKIRNTSPEKVLQTRITIPNRYKATLLAYSFVKHQLNMI
jgi:15-cis-phytoene synthase